MNMKRLSNLSLLRMHSSVLDELKRRDVLRTKRHAALQYFHGVLRSISGISLPRWEEMAT